MLVSERKGEGTSAIGKLPKSGAFCNQFFLFFDKLPIQLLLVELLLEAILNELLFLVLGCFPVFLGLDLG